MSLFSDQSDSPDESWFDYFTTMPTRQTGYAPEPEQPSRAYEAIRNALITPTPPGMTPRPMYDLEENPISEFYEKRRNARAGAAGLTALASGGLTYGANALASTGHPMALLPALGMAGVGTLGTGLAASLTGKAIKDNDRRWMWENTHFNDPEWDGSYNPLLGY